MKEPYVIYVQETVAQSLLKDLGTFATIVAVIGVGWLLGSSAMQWVGALIFFFITIAWATGAREKRRCTPQEAADRLRRDFGVVGREPKESRPGDTPTG